MPQLAGQKKLENEYEDLDMISKVNTVNMVGMMEAIKENLRLHYGYKRASLGYVISKTICPRSVVFTHDMQLLTVK